jgi:cytochrome c5
MAHVLRSQQENEMKFALLGTIAVIEVLIAGPATAAEGKDVYAKACAVCHTAGVAKAPKLGDKAAWAPLIKQGTDALVASTVKGKGAMPPKAGNAALSDNDIKAAVEYMISQAK